MAVGVPIPSLATKFSNTYRQRISCFGSNWFQYSLADGVSTSPSGSDHSLFAYPYNALKSHFIVITHDVVAAPVTTQRGARVRNKRIKRNDSPLDFLSKPTLRRPMKFSVDD